MISFSLVIAYFSLLTVCYTLLAIRPIAPLTPFSLAVISTAFEDTHASTAKEDFSKRLAIITHLLLTVTKQTDLLIFPESTFYLDSIDAFDTPIPKNFTPRIKTLAKIPVNHFIRYMITMGFSKSET